MPVVSPSTFDFGSPRARALLDQALNAYPARLDLAALAVAALENPELDTHGVLEQLDRLAARVTEAADGSAAPISMLQALRQVLSDEERFRGNDVDYHAPENSFLPTVLKQRLGLPITLAVVYLEVARRAGIPLFGVSLPGHFVVASELDGEKVVLDPFHAGQLLSEKGCAELLEQVAPRLKFTASMISPAPVKTIAYRMLSNLKHVYLEQGDGPRVLKVVDLMLAIAPDHPGELRLRAAILSALGAYRAALADIERCLSLSPPPPDRQQLEHTARSLRHKVEYLN